MKEKIIAAIKTKFTGINLSRARLNAIAAKIESIIIDDETKIDAELDTYNRYNPISEIAKTDDRLRNYEAAGKPKEATDPKTESATPGSATPAAQQPAPADDETPPYMRTLLSTITALQSDIAAMKGEKTATTIRQKAADQLAGIPEIFWGKRALPDKEDSLPDFITDVKADFELLQKESTDKGLGMLGTARAAAGGKAAATGTEKPASKEEVDAVFKQIMPV